MPTYGDPLGEKPKMVDVIAELAKLARGSIGVGMGIAHAYRPFIMMCLDSPGLSARQIAADIGRIHPTLTQSVRLGN